MTKKLKKIIMILIGTGIFTTGLSAQDSLSKPVKGDTVKGRKIRYYERTMEINGSPEEVFAFMDDIKNTGMHMTESSGAMMGGKLHIHWLTDHQTGLGTKYRWTGKVVGMKMDFTVEVSKWINGKEKVWGTVGDAKMIVIDWFEMYLAISTKSNGKSEVQLSIYYTKHKGFLGFLLGKSYSKWCVKSMLKDTRKHFEKTQVLPKKI
ncbi:MAG: SRPBCC family protein [Bacteroidetes bacterium]|nr:SRPBCC family protein [Bacteroidota bacterium]